MKTSVVIATRNSGDTIAECLSSLMPYYEGGYISEIIVVDGASIDGTLEIIKNYPVKLMTDPGKGMFIGYEAAWRETKGELVMFIDSDAYLDAGFFPSLLDYFKDEKVGIVGCMARATARGSVEKSIGQWWDFNANVLAAGEKPKGWLKGLYYSAIGYSNAGRGYTSGPLYVARRSCLEKVNGFSEWLYLYDISPRLQYPGDVYLSRSIVAAGWSAKWWLDAPAYHHPPSRLKKLVRQRYEWGKGDGVMLKLTQKSLAGKDAKLNNGIINPVRGNETTKSGFMSNDTTLHPRRKSILAAFTEIKRTAAPPLLRLATPVLGLILAVRYRNPLQIVLFPLAHFVWIAGYLDNMFARQTKTSK